MQRYKTGFAALAVCIFLALPATGQNWVQMMENPDANFYEIQRAFEEHWEGRTIERGKGWKQFKRWEYFMEPRVYPSGRIPEPDQAARAFAESMQRFAALNITDYSDWQPLGPDRWETVSYNPGVGRINCIVEDPSQPGTVYVGAPSGGFWRSYDGGNTWETTTDHLPVLGVRALPLTPPTATIFTSAPAMAMPGTPTALACWNQPTAGKPGPPPD